MNLINRAILAFFALLDRHLWLGPVIVILLLAISNALDNPVDNPQNFGG